MTLVTTERGEPKTGLDAKRVECASNLQKDGLTFTEIAEKMRVDRQSVVAALYWRRV